MTKVGCAKGAARADVSFPHSGESELDAVSDRHVRRRLRETYPVDYGAPPWAAPWAAAAMRAANPSVDSALWLLVLLTCLAVCRSLSGGLDRGPSGSDFGRRLYAPEQEHHEDRGGHSIDHERVRARGGGRGSGKGGRGLRDHHNSSTSLGDYWAKITNLMAKKQQVSNPPDDNVTTVDSWLNGAKKGFCGHTIAGSLHECRTSGRGSIGISMQAARALRSAVRVCLNACAKCQRCNYITVNPEVRDCSWYATCDMDHLLTEYNGFLSGPVVKARHAAPSRAATSRGPASPSVVPEPQEVILCMHMEKTAGTVARSWFEQHGWQKTSYCVDILGVQRELIKLLRANHKRIFVEHHCALDW